MSCTLKGVLYGEPCRRIAIKWMELPRISELRLKGTCDAGFAHDLQPVLRYDIPKYLSAELMVLW